jgi:hypothetical protein
MALSASPYANADLAELSFISVPSFQVALILLDFASSKGFKPPHWQHHG